MGKECAWGATLSFLRLNFVVEGQTEERFVNEVLSPYLADRSIYVAVHCITTQYNRHTPHIKYRGGLSTYRHAYDDIQRWIRRENDRTTRFTTMFDLYGLPSDFPGYAKAAEELDPYSRVNVLENALQESINDWRFIPYIQIHEFESLLFSDIEKLGIRFPQYSEKIQRLAKETSNFRSPELINDGAKTAPSKRIIEVFPEYHPQKVFLGTLLTSEIGIPTLKANCLHFREWIERLETLCN